VKSIQEFAAVGGRNRYGSPFAKLDLQKQVTVLLDLFGGDHQHRSKGVGNLTKKARAYVIFQFFKDIKAEGYPIKNIFNLDQRHVQAAVRVWLRQELAPSTIQSRLSHLRWLACGIGKGGLILDPEKYGVEPHHIERVYVAQSDKSWSGKDVISEELIKAASNKDMWVGIQLELMSAFGLRVRESVLMRPRYSDCGPSLTVEEGTKGGRTRVVPIRTPEQRDVLDRAKQMSLLSARGALVPPGKDPSQAINRLYYVCRLLGITKAQLAITPHGLRHQYANDRYEEVSGMASTVRGGPVEYDRAADERGRQAVTQELGHARLSITASYTGARVKGRPRLPITAPAPDASPETP